MIRFHSGLLRRIPELQNCRPGTQSQVHDQTRRGTIRSSTELTSSVSISTARIRLIPYASSCLLYRKARRQVSYEEESLWYSYLEMLSVERTAPVISELRLPRNVHPASGPAATVRAKHVRLNTSSATTTSLWVLGAAPSGSLWRGSALRTSCPWRAAGHCFHLALCNSTLTLPETRVH